MNAIVEIAGRDSFAAAIKFSEENEVDTLYPTYVHTGTEFGDMAAVKRNVDELRRHLKETRDVEVDPLEELADYTLWKALNGRFISVLIQRYGFYTPCIGCHLYVHLARIPLARKLGIKTIVAGEREYHEAGAKINQTRCAIDAYKNVMNAVGIDIVFPVRSVERSEDLLRLADWLWDEGENQLKCVLSSNYRDAAGMMLEVDAKKQEKFAKEFIEKAGTRLAQEIIRSDTNYEAIVEATLRES